MEHWRKLAQQIDAIDAAQHQLEQDYRDSIAERARAYAEGRGTAQEIFKRTSTRRLSVYPWTATELERVAALRGVPLPTVMASILDEVAWLWAQHPYDDSLYLTRPEDPTKADIAIVVPNHTPSFLGNLRAYEGHDVACFISGAIRCLRRGLRLEDLLEELEKVAADQETNGQQARP